MSLDINLKGKLNVYYISLKVLAGFTEIKVIRMILRMIFSKASCSQMVKIKNH